MRDDAFVIKIHPARVFRFLLLIIGLLTLANLAVLGAFSAGWVDSTDKRVVDLFYFAHEGNVPTWFSTVQLVACSFVLGLIARAKSARGDPYTFHWKLLCAIFLLLSLDETAHVHESFNRYIHATLSPGGLLYYPWVALGLLAIVLLAVIFAKFLIALDVPTRRGFLLAGGIFLAGALGMESIGGWIEETRGKENWAYFTEATLEELFEMLGMTVFLVVLLDRYRADLGSVYFRIEGGP